MLNSLAKTARQAKKIFFGTVDWKPLVSQLGKVIVFLSTLLFREDCRRQRKEQLQRQEDVLSQKRQLNHKDQQHSPAWAEEAQQEQDYPLYQNEHEIQAPVAMGNQGMNVHDGNRDEKTKDALIRLQEHQGNLDQETIDQAVQEFVEYLKTTSEEPNVEKKRNALRTLQHLPDRPEENFFSTLLEEQHFTIAGHHFTGPEIIARLWIFSNSYQDSASGADIEKERKNARVAMISALNASVEDGMIVCNPGKTQRLVVSVLQGRLSGVDVDQIQADGEETSISAQEAVNVFFLEEKHKQIASRAELLQAATQYCIDKPRIPKQAFLDEINAYADVSGFD